LLSSIFPAAKELALIDPFLPSMVTSWVL
jgi:hypothetical protein